MESKLFCLIACFGLLLSTVSCRHELGVSKKSSASEMPESAVETFARVAGAIQTDRAALFPAERVIDLIWARANSQLGYLEGVRVFRDKEVNLAMDASPNGSSSVTASDASFYDSFSESDTVYKPARVFRSGVLSDVTVINGQDPGDEGEVVTTSRSEFKVESPIDYTQTAWHQQTQVEFSEDGGRNITYLYQSQPVAWVLIDAGGRVTNEAERHENIDKAKGWTVKGSTARAVRMKGSVSMYRPVLANAEANTESSSSHAEDSKVDGDNTTRTVRDVTITNDSETPESGIIKRVRTVVTQTDVIVTHTPTSKVLKRDESVHTTVFVSFEGAGDSHSLGALTGYEETTKTLKTTVYMYTAIEGDYSVVSDNWIYRYTDNPYTRHQVENWKSTHRTESATYKQGDVTKSLDTGEIWLTEQIEPDPDVTQLPFEIDMEVVLEDSLGVEMFGADFSGKQTKEGSLRKFDTTVAIGGTSISAKGEIQTIGNGIAFHGSESFNNRTEPVGVVKVKVGEGSWSMSAEEFAGRLASFLPLEGGAGTREYVDPEVRRAREALYRERERQEGRAPDYDQGYKREKPEEPKRAYVEEPQPAPEAKRAEPKPEEKPEEAK